MMCVVVRHGFPCSIHLNPIHDGSGPDVLVFAGVQAGHACPVRIATELRERSSRVSPVASFQLRACFGEHAALCNLLVLAVPITRIGVSDGNSLGNSTRLL